MIPIFQQFRSMSRRINELKLKCLDNFQSYVLGINKNGYYISTINENKSEKIFIDAFLKELRNNPDYIADILKNCNSKDTFEPLCCFVTNFLFEDYFSDYEGYNELLFIINKTLEKELYENKVEVNNFLNTNSVN